MNPILNEKEFRQKFCLEEFVLVNYNINGFQMAKNRSCHIQFDKEINLREI